MAKKTDTQAAEEVINSVPCPLVRRIAAILYDGLLLIGLWMLAAAFVVVPLDTGIDPGNGLFQLYLLVVAWLYFALSWRGGHTLGMKAWRIRLVAPEQTIGWLATLIRFSAAIASWLVFGLGFIWSLGHPRRATWHDLASGTALVVDPPRPSRRTEKRPSRPSQQPDSQPENNQSREQ